MLLNFACLAKNYEQFLSKNFKICSKMKLMQQTRATQTSKGDCIVYKILQTIEVDQRSLYGSTRICTESVRISTDLHGSVLGQYWVSTWSERICTGSVRISMDQYGSVLGQYGSVWISMDQYGSVWIRTDLYGSIRICTGLYKICTRYHQICTQILYRMHLISLCMY